MAFSQRVCTTEQKDFLNAAEKFDLFELSQEEFTHRSGPGISRIDRIFCNYAPAAQLDHIVHCEALPWPPPRVSAHRPLVFGCRPAVDYPADAVHLDDRILEHPDWKHRTLLNYAEAERRDVEDGHQPSGIRRLVLLKRAMITTAQHLQEETRHHSHKVTGVGTKDELCSIMSFLRAVRLGRFWRARQISFRLECLGPFRDISGRGGQVEADLRCLHAHAMDLGKRIFVEDLRREDELQRASEDAPEGDEDAATPTRQGPKSHFRHSRRGQLMARLAKLKPGSSTTLRAVRRSDGQVAVDTQEKLDALREHWAGVFKGRPHDSKATVEWFRKAYRNTDDLRILQAFSEDQWRIQREDVSRALDMAGKSAPGPDGVPYRAWQTLRNESIELLWQAAGELQSEQADDILEHAYFDEASCMFNHGILCFLPKQASEHDEEGLPIFTAGDTRPLCIVDTANRVLANAARLRWEALFSQWLLPEQKGFLPWRSMLSNVVDLETKAMHCSLSSRRPALILFDFAAAFPSLSQEYLLQMLELFGLPRSVVRFARSLYYCHKGCPQLERLRANPIELTAGIRQGCPLSPLLFVVVVDGLLRCIRAESPCTFTRMYADDTAGVLADLPTELPILHRIFSQLAKAANLHLNIKKCVLIPLFHRVEDDPRALLDQAVPDLAGMSISGYGKYLGFMVGPEKSDLSWRQALGKAEERLRQWSWGRLGLFFFTQVWNTFIAPTLGFVAQLEAPPEDVDDYMERFLRKAAYGPGNWFRMQDVINLKRAFGFPGEFKNIRTLAVAAMLRTAWQEDRWEGGLNVLARAEELRIACRDTPLIDRSFLWSSWYGMAAIRQMEELIKRMRAGLGISQRSITNRITASAPRPWAHRICRNVDKNMQKFIFQALQQAETYDAEERIRQNIARFGLRDRRQAVRVLRRLRSIGPNVPPRVWAASSGVIWNRWATARRRQRLSSRCLLGCPDGADSIEHYGRCRQVYLFARDRLGIRCRFSAPWEYWLLAATDDHDTLQWHAWERWALLHYAVLKTTNAARVRAGLSAVEARRALWQAAMDGASGSHLLTWVQQAMLVDT